jgi:hypothetical protein
MVDIAKELGSEFMGGIVGLCTFIMLTMSGDPNAFDLVYYVTKFVDLAYSGAAALVSFLIVHIAKKSLESSRDNKLKRFVRFIVKLMKK